MMMSRTNKITWLKQHRKKNYWNVKRTFVFATVRKEENLLVQDQRSNESMTFI